jgi:hypothetical protein
MVRNWTNRLVGAFNLYQEVNSYFNHLLRIIMLGDSIQIDVGVKRGRVESFAVAASETE